MTYNVRIPTKSLKQLSALCTYIYVYSLCLYWLAVQESELECIQMQSKVEYLKEEKERLLNSLVEAE